MDFPEFVFVMHYAYNTFKCIAFSGWSVPCTRFLHKIAQCKCTVYLLQSIHCINIYIFKHRFHLIISPHQFPSTPPPHREIHRIIIIKITTFQCKFHIVQFNLLRKCFRFRFSVGLLKRKISIYCFWPIVIKSFDPFSKWYGYRNYSFSQIDRNIKIKMHRFAFNLFRDWDRIAFWTGTNCTRDL